MNKERRVSMNKKGDLGDQTVFVLFLFLLIIVGVGLVSGIVMVFGGGYDFRAVDASLLNYKVRMCMSQNAVDDAFFAKFYEICRINKEAVGQYYGVRICKGIGAADCTTAVENKIVFSRGRTDFVLCMISAAAKSENMELCGASEVSSEGNKYSILTRSSVIARAGGKI